MPDAPQLDHIVFDCINQQIRRLVHAPLTRVLVFTNTADSRVFKQGFGGVQEALSDLAGGFRVVPGDVIVGLFEVSQSSPGPA